MDNFSDLTRSEGRFPSEGAASPAQDVIQGRHERCNNTLRLFNTLCTSTDCKRAFVNDNHRVKYCTETCRRKARRGQSAACMRKWRKSCPKDATAARRRYRQHPCYLSEEGYEALFRVLGGACAVCGGRELGNKNHSQLVVDHDHETSKVRGLLCLGCNVGFGGFRDKSSRLLSAAAYLDRAAEVVPMSSPTSLAALLDPTSTLDAAESSLAAAVLFYIHDRPREMRRALGLASSALHLAAVLGDTSARLVFLTQAVREADSRLDDFTLVAPERRTV